MRTHKVIEKNNQGMRWPMIPQAEESTLVLISGGRQKRALTKGGSQIQGGTYPAIKLGCGSEQRARPASLKNRLGNKQRGQSALPSYQWSDATIQDKTSKISYFYVVLLHFVVPESSQAVETRPVGPAGRMCWCHNSQEISTQQGQPEQSTPWPFGSISSHILLCSGKGQTLQLQQVEKSLTETWGGGGRGREDSLKY